jgi:hypothetical protein
MAGFKNPAIHPLGSRIPLTTDPTDLVSQRFYHIVIYVFSRPFSLLLFFGCFR